jgi:hypothetical protein
MAKYSIVGMEYARDDSATGYARTCELHETDSRGHAIDWAERYAKTGMGGWNEIHVYGSNGEWVYDIVSEGV